MKSRNSRSLYHVNIHFVDASSSLWNAVDKWTVNVHMRLHLKMAENPRYLVDLRNCNDEADDVKFVINILRCQNPQCDKYLTTPIGQCEQGHSICSLCSIGPHCPLCKSEFIDTRSIALENLVNSLLLPCKNEDVGCSDKFPPAVKKVHEAHCLYSFFKCICPECTWTGERDSMWDHMVNSHGEHTSVEPSMKFIVDVHNPAACNYHKMILVHGMVFIAKLVYQLSDKKLYGAVLILDERDIAEYRYEFSMSGSAKNSERTFSFSRDVHTMTNTFQNIFEGKDCFNFPMDQVSNFQNEDDMLEIYLSIKRYF
ncbi:E3 ubiquitin-protein ligase SIAH1A [Anabrus simplex]|uniref:E3 ubiquitin-protein ligase SIAH1A n=1 Tax=Anabrus simplex TaxID=316456 RepID=UPI0035A2B1B2